MKSLRMLPISKIPVQVCQELVFFFMDIDDTFTTNGKITAEAYQALWDLHASGIKVIPVTGRPAGWCDMIVRFWPVEAVIGENGAFYFSYQKKTMIRKRFQSVSDRSRGQTLLKTLRNRVLNEIPGCAISADQPYRIADLAIDYCEDVPALSQESVDQICAIAQALGLNYKVSSIHVNCWYGHHDKLSCLKNFLLDYTGESLERLQSKILFVGDSPNDEPLFSALDHSIAVANIHEFLLQMTHHPTYVAEKHSGDGFQEIVSVVLNKRFNSEIFV